MTLLQINTSVNSGSTGRIAEDIGLAAMAAGGKSYIAAGYTHTPSKSEVISIGSEFDRNVHGFYTRITDKHGFASVNATKKLVAQIESVNPDVIGLHNVHGYYLNVEIMFNYLKTAGKPVVWTFHDCWPFTGHCTYFDSVGCEKWKTKCYECPKTKMYPASLWVDNSSSNFDRKKELFTGLPNLHIVTPSRWLSDLVSNSFLNKYPRHVIYNGVDLELFKPQPSSDVKNAYGFAGKYVILGVASTWDARKGLEDFVALAEKTDTNTVIVLIGLSKDQIQNLPQKIVGISRTENIHKLAGLYCAADVFINPTWQDNFPTTNIEALACGTPVITYNTGGSPEAIDDKTGFVVEKGNINGLIEAINNVKEEGKQAWSTACRTRAVEYFNKEDRYQDYLELYKGIAGHS